MKIAQRLYEGVELGDQGAVGLITYMRTDSARVSDVRARLGARLYRRALRKGIPARPRDSIPLQQSRQDAHEAIRPTAVERDPNPYDRYLDKDELALYTLIFNRFVSSQMNPAVYDRTTVDIDAADAVFRATGQVMKFDGFMRVYLEGQDEATDDDEVAATLPAMTEGERLKLLRASIPSSTSPSRRRASRQATLIKELEEKGIGRPSTYATIMTSLAQPDYVEEDESKRLRPTSLGRVVTDLLVAAFPDIIEVGFTAAMEEDLDEVEEGKENWVKTLRRFYGPFKKRLGEAKKMMPEVKRKGLPTGLKCELDGGDDGYQMGPQRRVPCLLELSGVQEHQEFSRDDQGGIHVRESAPVAPTDEVCDKCGKPMVRKRSRFGEFLGCSGYPDCDGIKRLQSPTGENRSRLPGMQRGRDPRAPQPPRQAVLRMRPLSEVQVRELGQSRPASLPLMWRQLPGRESDQARGHRMEVRQRGMRLQSPRPGRP